MANALIDRLRGKAPGRKPLGHVTRLGARAGGPSLPPLPGAFHVNDGPHYHDVLAEMHALLQPDWYLEVGSRSGRSLSLARCNYVAIDPVFQRFPDAPVNGRRMHFLAQTSDDAFASGFLAREGIRPDLAFLDGLHLSEFLMRDLMNLEAAARPGATVALHDCLPTTHAMETRDDAVIATGQPWTGDVWKVLWWVAAHRPDLRIHALDAWPTGLVVIEALDPGNRILPGLYDRFLAEMVPVRLAGFGVERFLAAVPVTSAHAYIEALRAKGH